MDNNPWVPDEAKPRKNAKQRQFLLLTDVPEVFYGGAAGGGKTYATLIAAAQFVDVPGYNALLLRSTFGELNQPDAWIPLSYSWWNGKARWNGTECRWHFPSGATVSFGYLKGDRDVYQYDGGAYQFIAIDELTQHTEWRYKFMFGRQRRPAEGPLRSVPIRMRSTSNPGNIGHAWVKSRFIDQRTREPGAVFVSARLDDNAGNLDVETYRRDQLAKLDPVTRAQRERGDWDAVAGGRYRAEWFRRHHWRGDYLCRDGKEPVHRSRLLVFGTADTAASIADDADWTVGCAWAVTPDLDLCWLDMVRGHWQIPDIIPRLRRLYDKWGMAYLAVESCAGQRAAYQLCVRDGMACKELSPVGDKLVRATQSIVLAEAGRVYLPHAAWVAEAVAELVLFTGDGKRDAHDDIVDNLAYAAMRLDRRADEKRGGFTPQVIHQR